MKKLFVALPLAFALVACSSNPDPEYAPDRDDADDVAVVEVEADVEVEAAAEVEGPAEVEAVGPASTVARLSDEETLRLGQEAVALLFANDMEALWPRLDEHVQAEAVSAESFGEVVAQIFGQIGAEMNVVEEEVIASEQQPGISIYRRRSHYIALGQNADLIVAFNADGSIAGINIVPAE